MLWAEAHLEEEDEMRNNKVLCELLSLVLSLASCFFHSTKKPELTRQKKQEVAVAEQVMRKYGEELIRQKKEEVVEEESET